MKLVGLTVVFIVGVIFFDGWIQVVWAIVLGMLLATSVVGWLTGGDVRSLTWVRGAAGEQQTEKALLELPDDWRVFHDVPDGRRNWDHVAVGPGGVFAIDTKSYSAPANVENDMLRSGGIRTPGVAFRGSAVRLKETLEREAGVSTWVQAIVAIWGEFPQGLVDQRHVIYLDAARLCGWLESRSSQLSRDRQERLVAALESIASK